VKIFFTGHLGTIAQDIIPLFDGHEVIGFDKKEGHDLMDMTHIYRMFPDKPDLVFHLANIPHPSHKIPASEYQANNLEGTLHLLRVAKEREAQGIVFFSSLAALGFDAPIKGAPQESWNDDEYPAGSPPYDEDAEPLSNDWTVEPYGVSKVFQEKAIMASGIPYLIFRLGPYGTPIPDMDNYYNDAVSRNYVWNITQRILDGAPINNELIHVCRPGMWGGGKLEKWLQS